MIDTSLTAYRQDLAIKGYSPKTQKTYFACVRKFIAASGKQPAALAKDDVKSHLARLIESGKCSVSTMNQNYSALKYFFRVTLEKPWELEGIPRVKKHSQLPAILSQEELEKSIGIHTYVENNFHSTETVGTSFSVRIL